MESSVTVDHALYCWDVLCAILNSHNPEEFALKDVKVVPKFSNVDEKHALFVKWKLFENDEVTWQLRGCMGTFSPVPLQSGLAEWTIISAMKDKRFPPKTRAEFSHLECSVSLLTPFEECADYLDWEIGTNGIHITLPERYSELEALWIPKTGDPSWKRAATYLPEIAVEHGWTKIEAINSAIYKAGWRGDVDEELRKELKCKRYCSEKVTVSYKEYCAARGIGK